jgi:hypothetical protein
MSTEKKLNIYDLYLELQAKRSDKTITDKEKDDLLNICTLFLNDLLSSQPTEEL